MIEEHDFSKFMLIFVSIFMGFSIKNKPSVLALLGETLGSIATLYHEESTSGNILHSIKPFSMSDL